MTLARVTLTVLMLCCTWAQAAPSTQDDFDLGRRYRNGMGVERNGARGLLLIEKAARAGHAQAMFILSTMLALGEGAPRDVQGARRWLEAAAALELPEALQQLAMNLREGAPGYERDEARAAQLMDEVEHAMSHRAR